MSNIPWHQEPKPETMLVGYMPIGVIELPKWYSVTPAEELQIIPALKAASLGQDELARAKCYQELALIALRRVTSKSLDQEQYLADGQRLQKENLTIEDIDGLLMALIEELAEYLLSERNGWETPEPQEDAEKKSNGTSTKARSSKRSKASTGA